MRIKRTMLILFLVAGIVTTGQNIPNIYIKEGLENNLALKQKKADYKKSVLAIKEAKALYYPNISINSRYSVANGGRVIELPLGDLINPVYSTLNQLTSSENFPQIENEEINFLRASEHETKVRIIQPLFNPSIYYNSKIKSNFSEIERINTNAYKRELICEIKKAYYSYLKTIGINTILDKTKLVLKENIRVNQKLYNNHKITIDVVYRSKSELSKLNRKKAQAVKAEKNAASYFNFLLNKPLNSNIELPKDTINITEISNFEKSAENASEKREELKSLAVYIKITQQSLKLNKGTRLPTLSAVVEYGFQGEKYKFDNKHDFVMASFVLQWDIFTGFKNKSKIQKAKIDNDIISMKKEETENKIKLQVISAFYDLEAYEKEISLSTQELKSAQKAFKIISRKYKEGQANLLQFMDAENSMTNAELGQIIAKYDYKIKCAEYEKVTALYEVDGL